MIKKNFHSILGFILIAFTAVQDCNISEEFDYDVKPKLPISFNHLELDMTIEPDNELVRGVATYSISARVPGQTSVSLHASALEIDAVLFDGEEVEYEVSDGSLNINFEDTLSMTSESELAVTWQANNNYGLHKNRFGNFWSSLNPQAIRYWLPTYDHPRVEFSMDAEITLPADKNLVFNGVETSDEVTSADTKILTFKVDTPIPATGLNFFTGNFGEKDAQSGIHRIRIYSSETLISEELQQQLLTEAVQAKRSFESALSFEYPWESLKIVIIEDGFWDVKSEATGIVYVSLRNGDLSTQIKRGIAGQWFGQYQRMENWTEHLVMMELMKNVMFESASTEIMKLQNPDELWAVDIWNELTMPVNENDQFFFNLIRDSAPKLIQEKQGVVRGNFYTDYWYELTGLSFWDLDFEEAEDSITVMESESPKFGISLSYNEIDSEVVVNYENINGNAEELQSVILNVFTFDDSTTTELTFTGEMDTASVDVSPSVEFVTVSGESGNGSEIEYGKFPVMFLLAQLRSENVEYRRLAAELLEFHTDNPDLQLAIKDALESETDVRTKANLIETLGAFTAGATGTDMQFISELNSNYEEIQIAAIRALKFYQGNENVPGVLQQKLERTSSSKVFEEALEAFNSVADTTQRIVAAERMIRFDTTGAKSIQLLQSVAVVDTTNRSKSIALDLTETEFPFSTRYAALNILLNIEDSVEFWGERVVEFSSDYDPRIRKMVLEALNYLPETDAENIKEAIALSEFDPRVKIELN